MAEKYWDVVGHPPSPLSMSFRGWLDDLYAYRREYCLKPRRNELFFSQSGDDTTGSGTYAAPYKTVAKAITELAAAGEDTILYFKRGDEWNETGLIDTDLDKITIRSYGDAETEPYFNRFATKYTTGWTLAAGTRYTRSQATAASWVKFTGAQYAGDPAYILRRMSSSTDCENTAMSFFWGSNVLHVNLGDLNPNDVPLEQNNQSTLNGFQIEGDGCAVGELLVCGWGMDTANPHTPQSYQIRWELPEFNAGYAFDCRTFYGGTHLHALNNTNQPGGMLFQERCTAGMALQGSSGETIFNGYAGPGRLEYLVKDCTVVAGRLPNTTGTWVKASQSCYAHSSTYEDTPVDLYVVENLNTLDNEYSTQRGANSFGLINPNEDINQVRAFIIGEKLKGTQLTNAPIQRFCYINCDYDINPINQGTQAFVSGAQNLGYIFSGWCINCTFKFNLAGQDGTGTRAMFNGVPTTQSPDRPKFYHCNFEILPGDNTFRLGFDTTVATNTVAQAFNNIFCSVAPIGAATVSVGLSNTTTGLRSNAYRNITGGADTSTATAYGNDLTKVALSEYLPAKYNRPAPRILQGQGVDIGLEYDHDWRPRPNPPTIGAFEPMQPQFETISVE